MNNPVAAPFSQTYRVTPMLAMKPELEDGGKIIMPPSALGRIAQLNLVYPLLFSLNNPKFPARKSHCGVLEFTAEEGRVYVPLWMMQNIGIEPNDFIKVTSVSLPRASYAKFQPQSVDFLDISNPKAVLEQTLRKYSALTIGDIILFRYNNKDYYLAVLEARPTNPLNAVSIIETDMQVDFAAPIGYQEPAPKQEEPDLEDLMANKDELHDLERELDDSEDSYEEEKKSQFVPFGGSGSRISGKPINKGSNTLDALSKSPNNTSLLSSSPFGSGANINFATTPPRNPPIPVQPKPTTTPEPKEEPKADDKKFVAFGGKGNTLR
jgi:ubiquitin fusion degradation protein 1